MKGPRIFFNGVSIIRSKCPATFARTRSRREFPWQPRHMFVYKIGDYGSPKINNSPVIIMKDLYCELIGSERPQLETA